MKPFEIPYNFDFKLIDFLNIYHFPIHSIYLPPYYEDYKSAKLYYSKILSFMPKTRLEYEQHIKYINKYFPNKIMLLLQQNNQILDITKLNYYISLGFSKFCVGSITQCEMLKEIKNFEVIGSITIKINNHKLLNNDYKIFDGFVLPFPYNRNIAEIKKLPIQFNYILLINCGCHVNCSGTQHWFASSYEEEKKIGLLCPKKYDNSFANNIVIPEYDLFLFEPYINYFKLQGREYNTNTLINDIVRYTNPIQNLSERQIQRKYDINNIYHIK